MISKRLGQYLQYKGISFYAIENSVGASRGSISKAVKEGKNIGSNVLEKILIHYRDLNPRWLMLEEGEMLITNNLLSEPAESYGEEYSKLLVIKHINENENEWLEVPEFRKLLKSLSLSAEMKDMREEIASLKKEFQNFKKPTHG